MSFQRALSNAKRDRGSVSVCLFVENKKKLFIVHRFIATGLNKTKVGLVIVGINYNTPYFQRVLFLPWFISSKVFWMEEIAPITLGRKKNMETISYTKHVLSIVTHSTYLKCCIRSFGLAIIQKKIMELRRKHIALIR